MTGKEGPQSLQVRFPHLPISPRALTIQTCALLRNDNREPRGGLILKPETDQAKAVMDRFKEHESTCRDCVELVYLFPNGPELRWELCPEAKSILMDLFN